MADCGGPRRAGSVRVELRPLSNKRPSVNPEDDLETFVKLRFAGWPEWA